MLRSTCLAAAVALSATAAWAQQAPYAPPAAPAPMPAISVLAAQCFLCHGTDGRSESLEIVSLAGLPRDFIAKSLRDFRAGQKMGTIMPRISKGYSDVEIDALASYFSSAK